MTRSVSCLLVGTGGCASDDGIAQVEALIRGRFGIAPVTLVGGAASRTEVLDGLRAAAGRCQPGGLFVLLFSGHGGFDGHQHSWKLSHSALTDDDLAEAIAQFDRDTEIFIISDCCYGAGILSLGEAGGQGDKSAGPGDSIARALEAERAYHELLRALQERLRAFTSNAAARLRRELGPLDKARGTPSRGNVVLTAATDWLMVRRNAKNAFVRALCAEIPKAASYAELIELLNKPGVDVGQANWTVEADPAEVLKRPPLALE